MGVSPGYLRNVCLLPGSHHEQEFIISRSDPSFSSRAIINLEASEVTDWIQFEPGASIPLPQGRKRIPVKAIIDVPQNAEIKEYLGSIRVEMTSSDETGQVLALPAVKLDLNLAVVPDKIKELTIRDVGITDYQINEPLVLQYVVENQGCVASAARSGWFNIYDASGSIITYVEIEDFREIPAATKQEICNTFENISLETGNYTAELRILGENDEALFDDTTFFSVTGTEEEQEDDVEQKRTNPYIYGVGIFGVLLVSSLIAYVYLKNKHTRHSTET